MSKWTHPICDPCWNNHQPRRTPHRIVEEHRDHETCCYCGNPTFSGIYIRDNPDNPPHHHPHEETE